MTYSFFTSAETRAEWQSMTRLFGLQPLQNLIPMHETALSARAAQALPNATTALPMDALADDKAANPASAVIAGVDYFSIQFFQQVLQQRPESAMARPSAASSSGSLTQRLAGIDSKLVQGYQTLLHHLQETDPHAAAVLNANLERVLGAVARVNQVPTQQPRPELPGLAPPSARPERITIALEATLTQLHLQAANGVAVQAAEINLSFQANFGRELGQSDPLVLDLNDNGFETTTAEDGAWFDLPGNGRLVRTATVAGGDYFLALDRNGNGLIDDGRELFGDQHGAADGFAELAKFDDNADGRIDALDPVYRQLLGYRDQNRNGRSELNELASLAQLRLATLALDATATQQQSNGNAVVKTADFTRDNGQTGRVGHVNLNFYTASV